MAISMISGVPSVMASEPISRLSSAQSTANSREAAAQVNDARQTSEAVRKTVPTPLAGPDKTNTTTIATQSSIVPTSGNAQVLLQQASQQISRAYASGRPSASEMRAASEAYRAQASARDQLAQQRQRGGVRSMDVLA